MAQRKYMLLYHSYLDDIELLDEAERGRLLTACLSYSISNSVPDLPGNERFVFPHIRAQIDRDAQSYLKVCDKNAENARKRWDGKNSAKSVLMRSDATYANEKDNENENDNESDNESETDNENENKNKNLSGNNFSRSSSLPDPSLPENNFASSPDRIWSLVLDALKSELSDVALKTWFDDCIPLSFSDHSLVLKSPSPLKQDTINRKFMPLIRKITDSLIANGVISD